MDKEEYIVQLITSCGYGSVKEFADAINIPYTTLKSAIDRKSLNKMAYANVAKICHALGVTVDDLNLVDVMGGDRALERARKTAEEMDMLTKWRAADDRTKATIMAILDIAVPAIQDK